MTNEEYIRSGTTDSSSGPRVATKDDDPATHRSEGFLKSMWHNLTNHPAHRDSTGTSSTEEKKPEDKPKNPKD